jgi:tryptophan 2,3-dioxygenase
MELTDASQMPLVAPQACPFARLARRLSTWRQPLGRTRRPGSATGPEGAARQVAAWTSRPDAAAFPYEAVIGDLRRAGRHFASRELLSSLAAARAAMPLGALRAKQQLAHFLATALDKWDGRYDNPSYLALAGLWLPAGPPSQAAGRRDRLVALLVADALRFELAAADGRTALQPEMRPDARTVEKRCRHALLVLAPVLERLGTPVGAEADAADEPVAAARAAVRAVFDRATADEERMLQLTLLPVSRVHDECLFIRVLQSYEATFAHAAVELSAAAGAIASGDGGAAVAALDAGARVLAESSPLFSLIGTMQPQAFLTFREYTDGASAIQSRNYKLMESACRNPERERVDSAAYLSVPEVRAAVLAGRMTIDRALQAGTLADEAVAAVGAAMDRFASVLLKWRRTHHGVAGRMLGDRRGTGDTAGQAYLAQGMTIPVFAARCPMAALRGAGMAR